MEGFHLGGAVSIGIDAKRLRDSTSRTFEDAFSNSTARTAALTP